MGERAREGGRRGSLAGADAYLVKPCPAAALTKQIDRVLAGTRPSQTLRRPTQ